MVHDDPTPQEIVDSWIEMTHLKGDCPDEIFELGFSLNTLAYDDPEKAWIIICMIVDTLDRLNLYGNVQSEDKFLASNLGAGPLETLMAQHGPTFIDRVEEKAKLDDRMVWILGCTWKNAGSDQIWQRIRKAAGGVSR